MSDFPNAIMDGFLNNKAPLSKNRLLRVLLNERTVGDCKCFLTARLIFCLAQFRLRITVRHKHLNTASLLSIYTRHTSMVFFHTFHSGRANSIQYVTWEMFIIHSSKDVRGRSRWLEHREQYRRLTEMCV